MSFTLGVVIFAIGIGFSVALHEFGHLLTAKAFGMKATKYFVGFGPTLFSFRKGETEYGFKAIPAGGFVKIVGMTPLEADDDEPAPARRAPAAPASLFPPPGAGPMPEPGADGPATMVADRSVLPAGPAAGSAGAGPAGGAEGSADPARPAVPATVRVGGAEVRATGGERAFWRFPAWQRTVVLSAGSITHLLLAMIVLFLAALTAGLPFNHAVIGTVEKCVVTVGGTDGTVRDCQAGDPTSPASAAGLRPGDRVIEADGKRINTFDDLVAALRPQPDKTVSLTYLRGGDRHTVSIPIAAVDRKPAGDSEKAVNGLARVGAIGITPSYTEKFGPAGAVGATFRFTGTIITGTFSAIGQFPSKIPTLFSALAGKERDPNGPVSVVGVSRVGGQALQAGSVLTFVLLFAGFNIFIGVFNLFPLLPLDGGHIAILLFEKVRSRLARVFGRVDPGRVDYAKLLPLTMLVIAVFGGISVLAILADIFNPMANPFE
jgi:membrane-associated protease RseP (regulator of RpoE activity)